MAGKGKKTDTLRLPPEGLDEIMERDFQDKVPTSAASPPLPRDSIYTLSLFLFLFAGHPG